MKRCLAMIYYLFSVFFASIVASLCDNHQLQRITDATKISSFLTESVLGENPVKIFSKYFVSRMEQTRYTFLERPNRPSTRKQSPERTSTGRPITEKQRTSKPSTGRPTTGRCNSGRHSPDRPRQFLSFMKFPSLPDLSGPQTSRLYLYAEQ